MKQSIIKMAVGVGVGLTRLLPAKLWLRIREESSIIRRLDYDRHPIDLVVDSWIENDVRVHSCAKEPETVEWIETWFTAGDVFFDIGANVGAYSLVANSWLGGEGRIYAFEPGFVTFPQLCRNIYLNKASASISAVPVGLGNTDGLVNFNYQNLTTGGALHALGEPTNQDGERFMPVFTLPTLCYRLDNFKTLFSLPEPNHIKIDVDGTELDILKGAAQTLAAANMKTVLLETTDDRGGREIRDFLAAAGFELDREQNGNFIYKKCGLTTTKTSK